MKDFSDAIDIIRFWRDQGLPVPVSYVPDAFKAPFDLWVVGKTLWGGPGEESKVPPASWARFCRIMAVLGDQLLNDFD